MSFREAVLEGTKQATKLHDLLNTKPKADELSGWIDVFEIAVHQGSMLLFKNLKGILGAYLNEEGAPGILITTQRPLAIQRFTGAHELGHFFMGHETSIDGVDILEGPSETQSLKEVEANAFAAEFLAPKWLLQYHGRRQGWGRDDLANPVVVYQMALRLGLSYQATCRSLKFQKYIDSPILQSLLAVQPKAIKRKILPSSYEPDDWYGDVWLLTEADRDTRIQGQPSDRFVIQLQEKTGAGYLWDVEALREEGFTILEDERLPIGSPESVGADVFHKVTTDVAPRPVGSLSLMQRRPWSLDEAPLAELKVNYDVAGKEAEGIPRAQRRLAEAA